MKLVVELKEISDEPIIAVLTGNGRREQQMLTALAEKFNGDRKILFFPRLPIHPRPGSGLAALKAVKTYLKYKITRTLFLIDKEHFDEENISKKLESALKSFGIDVQSLKPSPSLREVALIINGLVGHRKVKIYTAILGTEKSMEECIAKLIELELRIKIDPNKRAISIALRKHKTNINTLLAKAQSKNLTTAFPSLTFILRAIEKNNSK
jgi:hypothetical protein